MTDLLQDSSFSKMSASCYLLVITNNIYYWLHDLYATKYNFSVEQILPYGVLNINLETFLMTSKQKPLKSTFLVHENSKYRRLDDFKK